MYYFKTPEGKQTLDTCEAAIIDNSNALDRLFKEIEADLKYCFENLQDAVVESHQPDRPRGHPAFNDSMLRTAVMYVKHGKQYKKMRAAVRVLATEICMRGLDY